jgi:hypothetical protein
VFWQTMSMVRHNNNNNNNNNNSKAEKINVQKQNK